MIILDNASYNYKQKDKAPTSKSRKDDIKQRRDIHNVQCSDKDIKMTLLDLVKQYRLCVTDEAIHECCYAFLLPYGQWHLYTFFMGHIATVGIQA